VHNLAPPEKKCDKKCYPSKDAAKKALRRQKHSKGVKPRYVYYCDYHSSYHLTSMDRNDFKKIQKILIKKNDTANRATS
jgi:hypothetical protein